MSFADDVIAGLKTNVTEQNATNSAVPTIPSSSGSSNGPPLDGGMATNPSNQTQAPTTSPTATAPAPATSANATATPATAPTITAAQSNISSNVAPQTGMASSYSAQNANFAGNVQPKDATAGVATATSTAVNPSTDTVQGRVAAIEDTNSPLMQRAIQLANERAAERGLQNSSIGTTAAQAAVLDRALPIAQQDAQTYSQARLASDASKNQASLQNAQLFTSVSQSNAQNWLQAGIVNQQQADAIAQFNAQSANQASQFNATNAQQMSEYNIDNLLKAGVINQDQANKMLQFNATQDQQARLAQFDAQTKTALQNASQSTQVSLSNAEQANKVTLANLDTQTRTVLANLDSATQTNLTNIKGVFQRELQGSVSAQSLWTGTLNNIAAIQNNDKMDANAKSTAINNILEGAKNALGMIGSFAHLDLQSILNFGAQPATNTPGMAATPLDNNGNPLDPSLSPYNQARATGGLIQNNQPAFA